MVFNPINGRIVQRMDVGSIRRVDLLPFSGDNHLHSVIVVGKNLKVVLKLSLHVFRFAILALHELAYSIDHSGWEVAFVFF